MRAELLLKRLTSTANIACLIAALMLCGLGCSEKTPPATKKAEAPAPLHHVAHLTFAPDGAQLAGVNDDGDVLIWKASSFDQSEALGKASATLAHPDGPANAIAFTADGALVATGSMSGSLRIWSPQDARIIRKWKPQLERVSISSLTFTKGDASIVAAIRVQDSIELTQLDLKTLRDEVEVAMIPSSAAETDMSWSADSGRIVFGHQPRAFIRASAQGLDYDQFDAQTRSRMQRVTVADQGGDQQGAWLYALPLSLTPLAWARFEEGIGLQLEFNDEGESLTLNNASARPSHVVACQQDDGLLVAAISSAQGRTTIDSWWIPSAQLAERRAISRTHTLQLPYTEIRSLALSPKAAQLALSEVSGVLRVIDLSSKAETSSR